MHADEAAHVAPVERCVQQHSGSYQPGSLLRVCMQHTPTPPSQCVFFPAENRAFCQACRADVRKKVGVSNSLIEIGSNRLIGPKMAIDLKPVP